MLRCSYGFKGLGKDKVFSNVNGVSRLVAYPMSFLRCFIAPALGSDRNAEQTRLSSEREAELIDRQR
jgi:hypothetical protein